METIQRTKFEGIQAPRKARVGIVGHAGCGHAHSHLGFVQDDSGGLAAVLALWRRLTGVDLTIASVRAETGVRGGFVVETVSGGRGEARARRGVTPYEARLAQMIVGEQAVCTQALAVRSFGRILGQGAMEVPVALQTAVANAAVSSLARANPDLVEYFGEGIEGNVGLGPNEDVEGNVDLAGKRAVMERFGLRRAPTLLVEGKVCAEPLSPVIDEPTFLIRAHPDDDNPVVARAYLRAAERLGYPAVYREELLKRSPDAMRRLTETMGRRLEELGRALREATTSREKVEIAAEINRFAGQDLGGVTFMSDDVHAVMGGVGQIPGTSACLSLFIPNAELDRVVLPVLSDSDAERFADVLEESVRELATGGMLEEAETRLNENYRNLRTELF